ILPGRYVPETAYLCGTSREDELHTRDRTGCQSQRRVILAILARLTPAPRVPSPCTVGQSMNCPLSPLSRRHPTLGSPLRHAILQTERSTISLIQTLVEE